MLCRVRAGRAAEAGVYTRIAAIDSEADVTTVCKEPSDRFGQPSGPVLTMLEVTRLRGAATGRARRYHHGGASTSGSRRWCCPIPDRSRCSGCTQDGAEADGACDARTGAERLPRRPAAKGYCRRTAVAGCRAACLVQQGHPGGTADLPPFARERIIC